MIQEQAKADLLVVISDMLEGKVNLIQGCRKVCLLLHDIEDQENPVFMIFRGIESETDHYPLGEARKWSDPDYIARIDKEIEDYLMQVRKPLLDSCRKILKKYS